MIEHLSPLILESSRSASILHLRERGGGKGGDLGLYSKIIELESDWNLIIISKSMFRNSNETRGGHTKLVLRDFSLLFFILTTRTIEEERKPWERGEEFLPKFKN